jgi:DNA-binding NarL/FixJ family response regulator
MGPREVTDAIRTVFTEGAFLPARFVRFLSEDEDNPLTMMEVRWLEAVRSGLKGDDLREALRTRRGGPAARRTIDNYSAAVREKLQARSAAQAVAIALKRRLIF